MQHLRFGAALAISLIGGVAGAQDRTIETIKTADYMTLPEDFQAIYIAGIIDGMAYAYYNYQIPEHEAWAACVRAAPLGDLVTETNAYLASNRDEARYPVAWSVARVLGNRRPC